MLRIFEEDGRDRSFLFPSRVFVCFHGLVFLPAERSVSGLVYSSASILIERVMDSWVYVTGWQYSGSVCDREHTPGDPRGLGIDDVRLPLGRNEYPKFTLLFSQSIFASWEEDTRLIRLSAYLTVTHLVVNLIVLVCLLVAVGSIVTCGTGKLPCSNLVVSKPAWDVLSALTLLMELCEPDNHPMRVGCY